MRKEPDEKTVKKASERLERMYNDVLRMQAKTGLNNQEREVFDVALREIGEWISQGYDLLRIYAEHIESCQEYFEAEFFVEDVKKRYAKEL